jgi:IS6 family transposase
MSPFKGRHFERHIILWAVRWYANMASVIVSCRRCWLSEGGNVDHTTIYRWVLRYAPEMDKRLRPRKFHG